VGEGDFRPPEWRPPPGRGVLGDVLYFIGGIILFLVGGVLGFLTLLYLGIMIGNAGGFIGVCIAFVGVIALTVFVVRSRDRVPGPVRALLTGFILSACFALLIAGICSLGGPMDLH
jgi:hypothetical protein